MKEKVRKDYTFGIFIKKWGFVLLAIQFTMAALAFSFTSIPPESNKLFDSSFLIIYDFNNGYRFAFIACFFWGLVFYSKIKASKRETK